VEKKRKAAGTTGRPTADVESIPPGKKGMVIHC
jgi:hypothetical protein